MKKYLVGATVGAVLTIGLVRWEGQESINAIQGRIDRMAGMITSLTEQLSNANNNKGSDYNSTPNDGTLWGEIRRLEKELGLANQAVDTLNNNSISRYEAAREAYNNISNTVETN